MIEKLALITLILWPIIPLFWIPVHGLSKIFKKLGALTYLMPLVTWLPLAYLIYENRVLLLQFKIKLAVVLNILGIPILVSGTLIHIWTGMLLRPWGLVGLPEVSDRTKSRLVAEGPFLVVRHPTYLAHILMLIGIFLMTEVLAIAVVTILDILIVRTVIIPLEEKELLSRFGKDYELYKKRAPSQ
ncbi:MAG: DUF1295 domain-containing protein [Nitrospirae bacterium]|nr:DUF1295 domain-containing protein [Nitrospirota bacterium]